MFRFSSITATAFALEFPRYEAGQYYKISETHAALPGVSITPETVKCRTKAVAPKTELKTVQSVNPVTQELEEKTETVFIPQPAEYQLLSEFFPELTSEIDARKAAGTLKGGAGPDKKEWNKAFPHLKLLGAGGFGVVFELNCENDIDLAIKIQARSMRIGTCPHKYEGEEDNGSKECPVGDSEHYVQSALPTGKAAENFMLSFGSYFSQTELVNLQPVMGPKKGWYEVQTVPVELLRKEGTVKAMGTQLFQGLKDLHAMDYAHNDIKPENLWYHPETQNLLLADWGSLTTKDVAATFFSMNNIPITEKTNTLRKRFNNGVPATHSSGGRQSWDIYMAALTLWGVIAQIDETHYRNVKLDVAGGRPTASEEVVEAAWERAKAVRHFAFFTPMYQMRNSAAPLYPMLISLRGASAEDLLKITTPFDPKLRVKGAMDEAQWAFEDLMRQYVGMIYNRANRFTAASFASSLEEVMNADIFAGMAEDSLFVASHILPAALNLDFTIRPSAAKMLAAFEQYFATGECEVLAQKAEPALIEAPEQFMGDAKSTLTDVTEMDAEAEASWTGAAIAAAAVLVVAIAVVLALRRKTAVEAVEEEEAC